MTLLRLADQPPLFVAPAFASRDECAYLAGICGDTSGLEAAGLELHEGACGLSAELPLELDPLLVQLAERISAALGLENAAGATFRMRLMSVGGSHPAHIDTYQIGGRELIATALLCVTAPDVGGDTVFMDAARGTLAVRPRMGQLLAWHNVTADGLPNPASRHLAATVLDGTKLTLTWFIYANVEDLAHAERGRVATPAERDDALLQPGSPGAGRGLGRVLAIVDDGVPPETVGLLQASAELRGVRVLMVDPDRFDFAPERALRDGDMLFRPAVSMHAIRVEQHLWHHGVATFHRDPEGPLFSNINSLATFARAGLAVPRTYFLNATHRDLIRTLVDRLGGLPVVLKTPGYSHGVGVIRVDSLASLFSVVDFMIAEGNKPLLTTYVPNAVHWRVVVVGDQAVAHYRNELDADDFRTSGSENPDDYAAPLPDGAAELAVRACHSLRTDHGGVDILEHPSGRLYLLEANSPCYYPQAQLAVGVDISGAMMEQLLREAEARGPASSEPLPELGI